MGTAWADRIERSFGDGPTPPPPAAYVASGRAAVRRRRLAAGAATCAVVAVLGGVGWASLPGGSEARSGQVAAEPTPTDEGDGGSTPSPGTLVPAVPLADSPDDVRPARPGEQAQLFGGMSVTVLADGTLVRRPGWTVDRLEVVSARDDVHRTWGVSSRRDDGGKGQWVLVTWTLAAEGSAISNPPGQRFATFDQWLAATVEEQHGTEGEPIATVRDGVLVVAAMGTAVLQQVRAPEQAAAYGPVEDQVAARFRLSDGTEVFGLVGPEGTTTVDPAVLETPTMAAFLRHLEAQGAGGEGLR